MTSVYDYACHCLKAQLCMLFLRAILISLKYIELALFFSWDQISLQLHNIEYMMHKAIWDYFNLTSTACGINIHDYGQYEADSAPELFPT